ncbi:hypothetical protein GCM10009547_35890 [Sporichthya brevicatena]|uniref:Type III secretion system (T3SS) SseB-like protein n=1 Tax=Sporichthya brevicatena TaxID=171442 RepID=A0ABP3SCA9_9ACTN
MRGKVDERQAEYDRWQELSRNATLTRLDMARNIAQDGRDVAPLLRALSVEPIFIRPHADGSVDVSTDAQGERFVHAFTSHVRLAASVPIDAPDLTVQQILLPRWAASFPAPAGVRLDPGTAFDVSLDARQVHEVRAIAAGIPTPAALRAVDRHETLDLVPGPDRLMDLDQQVVTAVTTHAGPAVAAAIRRAGARLDGIGGRDWPVYYLPADVPEPLASAIRADLPANVVLVPGTPAIPPNIAEYRAQAVALSELT